MYHLKIYQSIFTPTLALTSINFVVTRPLVRILNDLGVSPLATLNN